MTEWDAAVGRQSTAGCAVSFEGKYALAALLRPAACAASTTRPSPTWTRCFTTAPWCWMTLFGDPVKKAWPAPPFSTPPGSRRRRWSPAPRDGPRSWAAQPLLVLSATACPPWRPPFAPKLVEKKEAAGTRPTRSMRRCKWRRCEMPEGAALCPSHRTVDISYAYLPCYRHRRNAAASALLSGLSSGPVLPHRRCTTSPAPSVRSGDRLLTTRKGWGATM